MEDSIAGYLVFPEVFEPQPVGGETVLELYGRRLGRIQTEVMGGVSVQARAGREEY